MTLSGRFVGKTLLLSGATGIAAATAVAAVAEGAQVCAVSLNEAEGQALLHDLGSAGMHVTGDLKDAAVADHAVSACVARFGRLDAVFNVAGGSGRRFGDGPVHECTDEGWDATMALNARTTFVMCRAAVRTMLQQDRDSEGMRGAILNMASVLALSPEPTHFATHAYAASKGAVLALTLSMAAAYANEGIRVNAVAPALVRTPMSQRAQDDVAIQIHLRRKQPLMKDFLSPENVARTALFLLSKDAAAITGQTVTVDGGWQLAPG